MSRIGRMPVSVPSGVDVTIDANTITVKGKNGTLTRQFPKELAVELDNGILSVKRFSDDKTHRALHGLTRALIANMVHGVTEGFVKTLNIEGVGYRAAKTGKDLVMTLGFSHQVIMTEPEGITFEVPDPNTILVKGIDKQRVGQIAAEVRGKRPPEPYKGKGIKYAGETIIRKEGKAGKGKK